jgi:hypothetical protein
MREAGERLLHHCQIALQAMGQFAGLPRVAARVPGPARNYGQR